MKIKLITIMTSMYVLCGCNTTPTIESMTKLGTLSGYTASVVLNTQLKMEQNVRSTIISVVSTVEKITPGTNSTYQSTWTPIAQEYIETLVKDNKIPSEVGSTVLLYFGYLVDLVDSYIDEKDVRNYRDLTDAFIHGFCNAFTTNFKSEFIMKSAQETKMDEFTCKTLMRNFPK